VACHDVFLRLWQYCPFVKKSHAALCFRFLQTVEQYFFGLPRLPCSNSQPQFSHRVFTVASLIDSLIPYPPRQQEALVRQDFRLQPLPGWFSIAIDLSVDRTLLRRIQPLHVAFA
jgi:hypothetical protein